MTSEEVIGFCKENLTSFKKPKSVAFVDALPRNPQQKVLRSGLKMKYMGRLA